MSEVREGYKMTELGEIPSEWTVTKIDELISRNFITSHIDGNHGSLYPRSDEFVESGIPYISANSIKNGRVDFKMAKYLSEDRASKFKKGVAQNDDVLFAHNATVGPVAILKTKLNFVILSTSLTLFRCDANKLSPNYLMYYFMSPLFKNQYERIMGQTTRNQVPITIQKQLLCTIPNIREQQKIASILSTVDEQIDETEQLIVKTKELKKGLMQQLLIKGIGHTKFKQTELGEIPIEWNIKPIKEVAEIVSGGTPSKGIKSYWENGEILWATPTDITKNRGKYIDRTELCITQLGLEKSSARLLPPGAILMTSRATIGERSIAKTFISTNQGFKSFICKDDLNNEYMYYALEFLKPYFLVNASGSTFLEISKATTENQLMLIPSIKEQIKIASILSTVDEQIETYEEEKAKYEELKKGLMQQLLTGQIRVKC